MFPQIGFAQLLGLSDCDWFFENVWECEPRLVSGAIEGSKDRIMTLDDFEALLTSSIPGENVGSSVVEAGVARMLDGRGSERLLLVEEAYRKRCTILQSGLQLRWVPLARICQDIENQFFIRGVPLAEGVTANSYLTPAHSQGFDLHYDNHCAIVLQLHGSKKWTIFAPVDELPVERCTRPILLQELDAPLMETRLCAGDVLYIPRGYPHSAATAEEISLHVTLSVRPVTWAEAICAFCESEPLFRKSVTRTSNGWARGNGQTFFRECLAAEVVRYVRELGRTDTRGDKIGTTSVPADKGLAHSRRRKTTPRQHPAGADLARHSFGNRTRPGSLEVPRLCSSAADSDEAGISIHCRSRRIHTGDAA